MENKFGADIITLTDEEGNEFEFEHLDTIEFNSKLYLAFTEVTEDDSAAEIIILRMEKDENGEEMLVTVDDETELEAAYEAFMDQDDEDEE